MQFKRTALIVLAALALAVGAGGVGAQIVRSNQVIEPPAGDFTGRWVDIDKSPANGDAVYQRVYCVAYTQDQQPSVSCDWNDVRPMYTYTVSR